MVDPFERISVHPIPDKKAKNNTILGIHIPEQQIITGIRSPPPPPWYYTTNLIGNTLHTYYIKQENITNEWKIDA